MSPQGKNLLQRVASAIVLLPLVLLLVWLGGWPFSVLVAAAAGLCAAEMVRIALQSAPIAARALVIVVAASLPLAFGLTSSAPGGELLLGGMALLVMLLWVIHLLAPGEDLSAVPGQVGVAILTVVYTGGLLAPLMLLRQDDAGIWWIVMVLAVTFMNDTGAYFAGRALGKRKLYQRVSPGKTWAGFYGGLIGGALGAGLVSQLSQFLALTGVEPLPIGLGAAVFLGLVVAALASLGDLCESLLKRAFAVKDSGQLIPGHGGMLDRLDALLFTGPAVWLLSLLLA